MSLGVLGQLGLVGVSDLILCKSVLRISIKCLIPSQCALLFNKNRTDRHRHRFLAVKRHHGHDNSYKGKI